MRLIIHVPPFETEVNIIQPRTPKQVANARKLYKATKSDFFGLAMDEICERSTGKERTRLLRRAFKAECHHIFPLCLGGHPTRTSNLALCEPKLHAALHRVIEAQDTRAGIVAVPRYPGLVWIPS